MTMPVDRVYRLDNPIQHYAWGSRTAIAALCGRPVPSPDPEAELWMGAHPKAPSRVIANGAPLSLDEWIARAPDAILGSEAARRFGNRLPFLFKVLAAEEPLSIQAHPDREQAREGFERENHAGIPLSAPQRNYRDDNHKPEIICALTDFWGLNGFRRLKDLGHLLQRFCPKTLAPKMAPDLSEQETLQRLFDHLLNMDTRDKELALSEAIDHAGLLGPDEAVAHWMMALHAAYPGDIGILSPILLNLVRLQPGQAMFLPAGQLHAYLQGVGMELMANSDNVLRGGLTPKHVDRGELMRVLRFEPCDPGMVAPTRISPTEIGYPAPAEEFSLSKIKLTPALSHVAPDRHPVEILLVTAGAAALESVKTGEPPLPLSRGDSVLIPAAAGAYRLGGEAEIFKATVPRG